MRRIVVFFAVLTAAPTFALADFFGSTDRDILEAGGTVSKVAPNWRIVCFGEGGDVLWRRNAAQTLQA